LIKKALALLLLASACFADQVAVSDFKYLNSNENSIIIDPAEAQDLLNVDITPGGKSVKKRSGYGLYKTVFSAGTGVHGGFHGFDSSGNDIQIWGSSTSVKGIVGDATPTTIVSSMTLNATIDCADTQGSLYCVSSGRDFYIRTNGATLTSWSTSPLGTMIESTPDRIAVAGVAATPSTIHISGSNAFTTFTPGPLATDPFTEVIAAPGSHITHLRWGCQKLLWWKDQSFGYFDFDDQYSAQVKIVSDNIGTQDNTSAIDPGGSVWFRGQDGHIYQYDCSGLLKQTIEITPQIQTSGRRTSNLYVEAAQSEFQTGTIIPTGFLSTTLSAGDVVPSSFSAVETSNADFSQGTRSNLDISGNSLILSTSAAATGWTYASGSAAISAYSPTDNCGAISDKGGDGFVLESSNGSTSITLLAEVIDAGNSSVIASQSVAWVNNSCSWTARTITLGASYVRRRAKLRVSGGLSTYTSNEFTLTGGDVTFYTLSDNDNGGSFKRIFMDSSINDLSTQASGGISSISQGTYTSKAYNIGLTPTYASLSYNATINDFTPAFTVQHATSSTGAWAELGGTDVSFPNTRRYIRYISTFTVSGSSDALTTLDDVTLTARSSGTYYSQVVNRPNLGTWSSFNATVANNNGSNSFYLRSSTNSFTALSSTPSWTAQTPGTTISISTGTYFQLRDDFIVTGSTHNPTLADFTINWFEGSASDQAYMLYYDNAIWASVAYGVGISSNNYVFRRDLINGGWTLYNFGTGGFLIQNNHLYFGNVADGNVFQFGSGTSDNGNSITSYWKSKDFAAQDPFTVMQLGQIDLIAARNANQTLTATYTTDTSTSTAYSVTLSTTATTQSFIQSRKLLPAGKNGYTFNFKVGDASSTSSWEVLGFRITYTTLPWKPTQ
jgi:hypothetical protein